MKLITRLVLIAFTATAFVGCVHTPLGSRTVAIPASLNSDQVLEIAIDAAKAVGLRPVSKLDKANGIVEFGNFEMSEMGTTGQVRVRADHQAEITLKRTSAYVPLSVEEITKKFQTEFETRLKGK